jgi:ABC-type spermidine/putrescine transport system permease subunit II
MNVLRWIVFAIAAFAMNFPVIVTLITSFKSAKEIATNLGLILQAPTLANYAKVLTDTSRFNIYAFLLNSTVAAFIGSFLALLLCLPAAYAIVKTEVGKKHLLPIVANLRAVPLVVFAIPLYMMFQFVGLLDTRTDLGLILTIVNLPLSLMMMVNAIVEIPREIDEAARMDKANAFVILRRIVAPVITRRSSFQQAAAASSGGRCVGGDDPRRAASRHPRKPHLSTTDRIHDRRRGQRLIGKHWNWSDHVTDQTREGRQGLRQNVRHTTARSGNRQGRIRGLRRPVGQRKVDASTPHRRP